MSRDRERKNVNGFFADKPVTVAFLTLGCKVNFCETEKMMRQCMDRGFRIGEFTEKADVYVVNTCSVTNIADRKSRQMLHRARKVNPGALVVAVGCYVESAGRSLLEDEAIDAVLKNSEKERIADLIADCLLQKSSLQMPEKLRTTTIENKPVLPQGRTRAYLKIQDGCNQFCSYCLIPYVRGRGVLKSTPPDEAVGQAGELAANGYKEVVLTGIHLSSYGVDWSGEHSFVSLAGRPLLGVIKKIAEIPGIERIRLGSLEPRIISEEFLQELSRITKICPHFHLSLQSGCDSVLRRMNRHYTTVEYREKADMLRHFFSNPAITTDVIVGFPGETEEEFEETRQYLGEIRLADAHIFKYSPRTGTRAASMQDQVPPEVKNRRSDILIRDTTEYRREYGMSFLGREENVLFEEIVREDGRDYLAGHNERYVKIGVPAGEAEREGYAENEIRRVTVKKVMNMKK